MDDLLTLVAQQGYVLRRDALTRGWHDRSLREAVRSGLLVRARHGTYLDGPTWTRSSSAQRLALVSRAALARLGPGHALSHTSAAAHLGMDLYGTDLRTIHVTSLRGVAGRIEAGIVHHEGRPGDETTTVGDVPVVLPARAVVESACLSTVEGAVVTACSALRLGLVDDDVLVEELGRSARHKGVRGARLALSMSDGGCHSAGEARSLYLCWRHRLPRPDCQHAVHDRHGLAGVVDLAWLPWRHVGEFDGMVKYGRANPWLNDPVETLVAEKLREDRIRETGLGMSRWTWRDLDASVAVRTAARIRDALERSRSWYSTPA